MGRILEVEPMKLSDLIAELQAAQKLHGDVSVFVDEGTIDKVFLTPTDNGTIHWRDGCPIKIKGVYMEFRT